MSEDGAGSPLNPFAVRRILREKAKAPTPLPDGEGATECEPDPGDMDAEVWGRHHQSLHAELMSKSNELLRATSDLAAQSAELKGLRERVEGLATRLETHTEDDVSMNTEFGQGLWRYVETQFAKKIRRALSPEGVKPKP